MNTNMKESQHPEIPLLTFWSISFQIFFYSFFDYRDKNISYNQFCILLSPHTILQDKHFPSFYFKPFNTIC